MIISEVNATLDLLAKVGNFAGLLKDGWYKSSTELVTFPLRVENLTLKHKEWIGLLRKFGLSDDDKLTVFVEEAEKILSDEQKRVSRLKKSGLARWRQRAFPGRLTEILQAMETTVDSGLQLMKSKDEMFGLLERNLNYAEIPLPFQRDHKYVPIASSIAEVKTAVENAEGSRVVVLYGDGGLGKTSLVKYIALHYHKLSRERPPSGGSASQLFPDGLFYLNCGKGASTRIKELERELLENLGFGSEAGVDDNPEERGGENQTLPSRHHRSLRFKLAKRKTLIILDDVRECEVLERLLIPGESVTYLITSRRRDIWPDRDARKIRLAKPSLEDARKVLAMYTELPDNIKEIVDSIIEGVDFHPLMLANVGLAMGATGEKSPVERRRMSEGWRDELRERDFKYGPTLYGQSYKFSMYETMNLVMESLEEGERSFLLLMSLLRNQWVPEVIVKYLRKCIEPGEAYFEYRRYRNQLHDKSLLEVYSPHVQGYGPSGPDTENSRTYLAIHRLRALCIRKKYSEQLRSMAIRALELEPANHTTNYVADSESSMTGGGLRGAITATIDALRSLVTRDSGPINSHTGNSMITGPGSCGEGSNGERGLLTGILAAMYVDKTLFDVAQPNAKSPLGAPSFDLGIVPGSVRADVDVIALVQRARTKAYCFEDLVELLNPDGEEGWKQEAHCCATKIIVRLLCRQELDDISVAQLVQLEHTTAVICRTLYSILEDGYWATEFVFQNITFSSVHIETMRSLFDLLHNDTTPINILVAVINTLCDNNYPAGLGIFNYEDEDTILDVAKTFLKMLVENTNNIKQCAFISGFLDRITRTAIVMGKIPDLWKRVLSFLVDKVASDEKVTGHQPLAIMNRLSEAKSVASEIIDRPGALDMLWALIGSKNLGRREWDALHILNNLTRLPSEDHKIRICAKRKGLINLLNMLASSQERGDLREMYLKDNGFEDGTIHYSFGCLQAAVDLLGNLAGTKEVRKMILDLCPEISERLQILESSYIISIISLTDFIHLWPVAGFSKARTMFNSTLVSSGITDYSPPISRKAFGYVLKGRLDGCIALEMYKEAQDIHFDIDLDKYSGRNMRYGIVFAKAMLKDYAGALVIVNNHLSVTRNSESEAEVAYGQRGILMRLSEGDLSQAIADLDLSLKLIRLLFLVS